MRILRLVEDDAFAIEFHPYITVVRGLVDEQRRTVVDAFTAASTGRVSVAGGLIEAHGLVLDLDEESLALLELPTVPPEQTVRVDELPGSAGEAVARQVRAVERRLESLEQPRRDTTDALVQAEQRLEAAEADHAAAVAALAALPEPTDPVDPPATAETPDGDAPDDGSRARVEAHEARLDRRAAALDELVDELRRARAGVLAALAPGAAQAHDDALAEVSARRGRSTETAVEAGAPPDVPGEPGEHADDPERRRASLETQLALLRQDDPEPIRARLDELRQIRRQGEMAQSPRALSLADRIETLVRDATGADTHDVPTTADVEAAEARAEAARRALVEADRKAQPVDADVAALEAAHAEVEDAREASESKLRRARNQERLDAALAAEREILERLGLGSYTEFLLQGGLVEPQEDPGDDSMALRLAVLEAEAEVADLRRSVADALAAAEAVDELRRARNEARELLDAPDIGDERLVTALLNFREPADSVTPVENLARALEVVGLPVTGLDLGADDLEPLAADWLTDHEATIAELESELASSDDHDAGAEGDAPVSRADPSPGPEQGTVPTPDLERAEARLAAAEARLAEHRRAARELEAIDERLAEAGDARTTVADQRLAWPPRVDATDEVVAGEQRTAVTDPSSLAELRSAAERASSATAVALEAARAEVEAAAAVADQSARAYDDAVQELAALRHTHADLGDDAAPVDEIEWYLLARLAALRQVSFAGSVPLVIDRALDDVTDDDGLWHLLERLERMAGAVQIVHLTDDARIVAWAEGLTVERGAVVAPIAPADASG